MRSKRLILWVCLLLLGATFGPSEELALTPQEGVLVLRNGHVLSGRITPLGDHYIVAFAPQSETRLPVAQVDMCCATVDEAYLRKRERISGTNVEAHLDLASWCLRHQLYARAADQLLVAFLLDPKHPQLESLERRLVLADRSTSSGPTGATTQGPSMSPPPVERKSFEIPPVAVEYFTQRVQPILVNRCATNACHGAGSPGTFQITRPLRSQSLPPRTTQRNLQAALSVVDRERPQESRLLTVPQQPHGGLEKPVFGPRDLSQQELLASWVRLLAATSRTAATDSALGQALVRDLPTQPAPVSSEVRSSQNWDEAFTPVPTAPATTMGLPGTSATSVPNRTSQASPANAINPADPFDPEVFNRRYGKSE